MKSKYYKILGVSEDATQEEIRIAFMNLVKKYHPDNNLDCNTKLKMQEIIEAYKFLTQKGKENVKNSTESSFTARSENETSEFYYMQSKNVKNDIILNEQNHWTYCSTTESKNNELMIRARDAFDPIWQVNWGNFFNQDIMFVLFANKDNGKLDLYLRKIFSRIRDIQSNIAIGNDYEIEFLNLCFMIDKLDLNLDLKINPVYEDSIAPYFIAKNTLLRLWFKVRANTIFSYIDYFSKYGNPNSYWKEYIDVRRIMVDISEDQGHALARYASHLTTIMSCPKLNAEQGLELNQVVNLFRRFNNALEEYLTISTSECEDNLKRVHYVFPLKEDSSNINCLEKSFVIKPDRFNILKLMLRRKDNSKILDIEDITKIDDNLAISSKR